MKNIVLEKEKLEKINDIDIFIKNMKFEYRIMKGEVELLFKDGWKTIPFNNEKEFDNIYSPFEGTKRIIQIELVFIGREQRERETKKKETTWKKWEEEIDKELKERIEKMYEKTHIGRFPKT
jgi:hypothetical protein